MLQLRFVRFCVQILVNRARLEPPPKQQQISSNHHIHRNDEHKGHDQRRHGVHEINYLHKLEIDRPHFAFGFIVFLLDDPGDPE